MCVPACQPAGGAPVAPCSGRSICALSQDSERMDAGGGSVDWFCLLAPTS
jgi:hypothetical protein